MALDKKFKPSKSVSVGEGTYVGVLTSIINVGVQKNEWKGQVSYKDTVLFFFELPDVIMESGVPVTLSKRVNNTFGEKSDMYKALAALTGNKKLPSDGVDFESVLGKGVYLDVGMTSTDKPKINGFMTLPESLKKSLKPTINKLRLYLDVDTISDKELADLPEWVRKVINSRVKEEGSVDPDVNY